MRHRGGHASSRRARDVICGVVTDKPQKGARVSKRALDAYALMHPIQTVPFVNDQHSMAKVKKVKTRKWAGWGCTWRRCCCRCQTLVSTLPPLRLLLWLLRQEIGTLDTSQPPDPFNQ